MTTHTQARELWFRLEKSFATRRLRKTHPAELDRNRHMMVAWCTAAVR